MAAKSWPAQSEMQIKRPIKVKGATATPTLENEQLPTSEDLRRLFFSADEPDGVACALTARAGLRPGPRPLFRFWAPRSKSRPVAPKLFEGGRLTSHGVAAPSFLIQEMTSAQFARAVARDPLVVLPVGALEGHGLHLPLGADVFQPMALASVLAKKRGALVLPPLCYGCCGATRSLPGTVSLEFGTLLRVAEDLLEDLHRNGLRKVLVLSGHGEGGHMAALRESALRAALRHPDFRLAVLCDYDFAYELLGKKGFPAHDGHAGHLETSRLLALVPDLVMAHGRVKPDWPAFGRFEIVGNPENRWRTGVQGNPRKATARDGRRANAHVERRALQLVDSLFAIGASTSPFSMPRHEKRRARKK
jgi:creatinine amidohydrolase